MSQELSANTTLSHYRLVSKIGAGGMGEVYLAEDTHLERQVALSGVAEESRGSAVMFESNRMASKREFFPADGQN